MTHANSKANSGHNPDQDTPRTAHTRATVDIKYR